MAVKLFQMAAGKGVVEAQVNLANIYDEGDGVTENFQLARSWYRRAITQGSPEAAYNLGISYLDRGNVRWGRYWLLVATAMGDGDANDKLIELNKCHESSYP